MRKALVWKIDFISLFPVCSSYSHICQDKTYILIYIYIYIYICSQFFIVLASFSIPDTLRIFRSLVIVNFKFIICRRTCIELELSKLYLDEKKYFRWRSITNLFKSNNTRSYICMFSSEEGIWKKRKRLRIMKINKQKLLKSKKKINEPCLMILVFILSIKIQKEKDKLLFLRQK